MMSPCKDCKNRKLYCHSSCEQYKEFKAELERINNNRKLHYEQYSIEFDRYNRLRKRSK